MSDEPLRPAKREDAIFAIARALNSRHGHELSAKIAAEFVLAKIESLNMVVMQKPPLPFHSDAGHPRPERPPDGWRSGE